MTNHHKRKLYRLLANMQKTALSLDSHGNGCPRVIIQSEFLRSLVRSSIKGFRLKHDTFRDYLFKILDQIPP
ncbi:hypothetical protein ES703_49561 [subsurface metagenome]